MPGGTWNIVINNLARGTTAEEVISWLWESMGLELLPENVSVKDVHSEHANAMLFIPAKALVPLLNRYLCDQPINGRLVKFSQWQSKKPEYRVTVDQITVEFPTNRNGIRKL
jgi:hypothetical protein